MLKKLLPFHLLFFPILARYPLIRLMDDEKPSVRYAAARALSSIADKKALNVLKKAVKD